MTKFGEYELHDEEYGPVEFKYQAVKGRDSGRQVASVEEMYESAIGTARTALVEQARLGRDFVPMAFMYMPLATDRPHVAVMLLAEGFSGYEGKRYVGAALASYARKHQAAAIVLATDGWCLRSPQFSTGDDKFDEKAAEKWRLAAGPPSQHKDREEALTVNCVWPDGTCTGYVQIYKRHKMGHLATTADGGRGIQMGEDIEWGELDDSRKEAGHRVEQSIIPAWQTGETA